MASSTWPSDMRRAGISSRRSQTSSRAASRRSHTHCDCCGDPSSSRPMQRKAPADSTSAPNPMPMTMTSNVSAVVWAACATSLMLMSSSFDVAVIDVAPGEAGTDRHRVDDRVPRGPSVIARMPAARFAAPDVTAGSAHAQAEALAAFLAAIAGRLGASTAVGARTVCARRARTPTGASGHLEVVGRHDRAGAVDDEAHATGVRRAMV